MALVLCACLAQAACEVPGTCLSAGYSVWTNSNYKSPLIASGLACLLGNLAYCLSYDWNAVWLLFLARLITGFGAPSLLAAHMLCRSGALRHDPVLNLASCGQSCSKRWDARACRAQAPHGTNEGHVSTGMREHQCRSRDLARVPDQAPRAPSTGATWRRSWR